MKKVQKKINIVIIIILVVSFIYFPFYVNIGLCDAQNYCDMFIEKVVNLYITKEGYYADIIPYDDLSIFYKLSISEEEILKADSDKKRLELYRKVIDSTLMCRSIFYCTTRGWKKGDYDEILIVDGIKYKVEHSIDIEANCFTFKPYISNWVITIKEIPS